MREHVRERLADLAQAIQHACEVADDLSYDGLDVGEYLLIDAITSTLSLVRSQLRGLLYVEGVITKRREREAQQERRS